MFQSPSLFRCEVSLDERKRMPLESFDLQKNQIDQDDVFSPEYINDFIFVPAELHIWE